MNMPSEQKIFADIFIEDGIVYMTISDKLFLTKEIAESIVNARKKLVNGISYPMLVNVTGLDGATKEARTFIASDEGSEFVTARAVLVRSKIQVIAVNFYINFDKPSIDTRLFTEEEEAVSWLKKYKA